jgi:hypothetical protein
MAVGWYLLSTEAGAIFEQHLGTGSSGYRTTSQSQPRLSVFLWSLADDRRLRGSQEGTGKTGRQG